jgi:protein phosphatase
MKFDFRTALDTGRARFNNEDAVLVDGDLALFVLADGMGGYNAGEVASDLATRTVHSGLKAWTSGLTGARDPAAIRLAMSRAADDANRAVYDAAQADPACAGMGTTLVVAWLHEETLFVGHIGDSRAYLWRAGVLSRLSRDHSLLQEQIDAGLIRPEDEALAAHRNLVTRAVGVDPEVELEVREHALKADDLILICSDGVSDMLPDASIAKVLSQQGALDDLTPALVEAANAAGGRDNIGLILVRIAP